jgi:hypothetical protein
VQEKGKELGPDGAKHLLQEAMMCLEMMVAKKWVAAYYKHGEPSISMKTPLDGEIIYGEEVGKKRRAAKNGAKTK